MLFFANPNIHPSREYEARLDGLNAVADLRGLPLQAEPSYEPQEFFRLVNMHEDDRCRRCYQLRLEKTARKAVETGLIHFSTTLLISPYQNRELLLETGRDLAREYGLEFVEADWRPGFRQSQAQARAMGLYRQQYCGCLYSERDRYYKDGRMRGKARVKGREA